ncbi:MAG TPA: 30S ribosomal protein S8 [Candidatus Saccharibacteria bacterium]|nr:30S ribosomal protein S8 [Candidatus Saccharibacteria bacterium]MCB9817212.1 30S ribosomal protein S8 [Candidatus Nomurabacteria bacterium]HPR10341.1 30S ribosomal protein S8 [Candidatus Saccharibacteria bacterium]
MVSTDPIADMLTRIRNAVAVNKHQILVPFSKVKVTVLDVLKQSNFISSYEIIGEGIEKHIVVQINEPNTNSRITAIERISKPGRRVYSSVSEIPKVKYGRGIVVVSTSKGIMTGIEAKKAGLGGELICRVY